MCLIHIIHHFLFPHCEYFALVRLWGIFFPNHPTPDFALFPFLPSPPLFATICGVNVPRRSSSTEARPLITHPLLGDEEEERGKTQQRSWAKDGQKRRKGGGRGKSATKSEREPISVTGQHIVLWTTSTEEDATLQQATTQKFHLLLSPLPPLPS